MQSTYSAKSPKSRLKDIALQLCTCTWIEIFTGIGVTAYLLFGLQDVRLAIIAAGLFAPLIGFHFAISRISSHRDDLVTLKK